MPTLSVVHVLSEPEPGWSGEKGKLDEALLRKYVPDPSRPLYWISGPPLMVQAYKDLLKNIGVADPSVRVDSFSGY